MNFLSRPNGCVMGSVIARGVVAAEGGKVELITVAAGGLRGAGSYGCTETTSRRRDERLERTSK